MKHTTFTIQALMAMLMLSCSGYGKYYLQNAKKKQNSGVTELAPIVSYQETTYSLIQNSPIAPKIPSLSGGIPTSCISTPPLPSGLIINSTTCIISGTPTSMQTMMSYTITASNEGGSGIATLNIAVKGPCPTNYIAVPANSAVGTNGDFCVAKYEMKNNSGIATSQMAFTPWVSIDQPTARTNCSALGTGYHLITNPEWMTIARSIELTAVNWSGGAVYSGALNKGHTDSSPLSALDASVDNDGCFGTGQTCSDTVWDSQRRTFTLSNGEVIWDFAGNVWEWVDWQVAQSDKAYSSADGGPVLGGREWTAIDTYPNNIMLPSTWQPSNPMLDSSNGIGKYDAGTANPGGAQRGGRFGDGSSAGIYDLTLKYGPTFTAANIGFRCTYSP